MATNFVEVTKRISDDGSSILVNMDGYTTFKTLPAVLHDVAKEVKKYDPLLAADLAAVKTKTDAVSCLMPMGQHDSYIFEVEDVPCACSWNEETEEMTYADGSNYFHILFCVNNPEYKEKEEAEDLEENQTDDLIGKYTEVDKLTANFKDVFMSAMVQCMSNEYERLYKLQAAGVVIHDFYEAMQAGDKAISDMKTLTRNFNAARGDCVVSDREVAAYGYTLRAFGLVSF